MTNKYLGVQEPPVEIDDEEKLARCVFGKRKVGEGKVKPNAFSPPKKSEQSSKRIREISVDRFDYLDMERAVQLGQKRAE